MKTNLLKIALLSAVTLGAMAPLTASADPYHRHYNRHRNHHRHSNTVVVVNPRPVVVQPRGGYYAASVQVDVQRALAKRGYYRGVIDGDIGPRTRASIRAYQVDRGLPVTGVIDTPLLRSLRLI